MRDLLTCCRSLQLTPGCPESGRRRGQWGMGGRGGLALRDAGRCRAGDTPSRPGLTGGRDWSPGMPADQFTALVTPSGDEIIAGGILKQPIEIGPLVELAQVSPAASKAMHAGQYQGAGVLTGFGLRLWHLAQR